MHIKTRDLIGRDRNTIMHLTAIKTILYLLDQAPHSQDQLIELTGLSRTTISKWIQCLHNNYPRNIIYISRYWRDAKVGPWTKFYSFGIGKKDEPPPKLKKRSEYQRNYKRCIHGIDITQIGEGKITHALDNQDVPRRHAKSESRISLWTPSKIGEAVK